MIDTKTLELNNVVFVDETMTNEKEILKGTVLNISDNNVVVLVNGIEITCTPKYLYPIPLSTAEVANLGFVPRSLTLNSSREIKNDLVYSIETEECWYLLELTEKGFLTVKQDGIDILGGGKVASIHQFQNLINQITGGKIKIKPTI